ncbi:MAG: TIGR02757 family protein [Bacteroidales bacterium]|nr:TIGR02757 family protein [Bacteroidales bacterium]
MMDDIKAFLDEWVEKINVPAFIEKDPVQFPLRFNHLKDIEVAAILTATITWGNRKMILNSAQKMFATIGSSPYDYIMTKGYLALGTGNIHRTFFEKDLLYLCQGLNGYYSSSGEDSLECLFARNKTLWDGIAEFRHLMASANNGMYSKHVSNPMAHSACKRLNLALRWLVRKDGHVDPGIWKKIDPSQLYIPLDIHVGRISRELGILDRKQNDKAAVELLTDVLRIYCPEDPVKYDFALFGIGESGKSI